MNRYKQCRISSNMSQKFVALSVGVSPPMVSQWESGVKEPSKDTLVKLADLFGVTTDYLLEHEQIKKEPAASGEELNGLKEDISNLFLQLSESEQAQMRDYAEFLLSRHEAQ